MDINQAQKLLHQNGSVIALQVQLGSHIQYIIRVWDDQNFTLLNEIPLNTTSTPVMTLTSRLLLVGYEDTFQVFDSKLLAETDGKCNHTCLNTISACNSGKQSTGRFNDLVFSNGDIFVCSGQHLRQLQVRHFT